MNTLIISEEIDRSSDIVCAWLNYFSVNFTRFNGEEFNNPKLIVNQSNDKLSVTISLGTKSVNLSEIESVWFRRGYLYTYSTFELPEHLSDTIEDIDKHLDNEGRTLRQFLFDILYEKRAINHPESYNCNKLTALHEAARVGLKIPDTVISNDGDSIRTFVHKHNDCITKCIQDISSIRVGTDKIFIGKIQEVEPNDITEDFYWYSLFQKKIPKKYELRVFYFLGKMYAMAIFSQLDDQSKLDFRDVDVNGPHPNRMVPYRLPKDIKTKLNKLMKRLNLESGSIDIIVTPDDDFVFLEVNPVGQFNFVGELCNYSIEKNIAIYLAK